MPDFDPLLIARIRAFAGISGPSRERAEAIALNDMPRFVDGVNHVATPEEFIESDVYFGKAAESMWPKVKEHYLTITRSGARVIVLTGSIGWGKGFCSAFCEGYFIQTFMAYKVPQALCGLSPMSPLFMTCVSENKTHAKESFLDELRGLMSSSPFFCDTLKYDKNKESEIEFPANEFRGRVTIKPCAPDTLKDIGLNLIGTFMDEYAFMDVVNSSKRAKHGEKRYDQATEVFGSVERRLINRTTHNGHTYGKIMVVSSANYEGDAIARLVEKRKDDKENFIWIEETQMQTKPSAAAYGIFKVFIGDTDKKAIAKILTPEEEADIVKYPPDKVREVAEEFRKAFEADIQSAMTSILGIRSRLTSHLLHDPALLDACFDGMPIFVPYVSDMADLEVVLDQVCSFLKPKSNYAVHFDYSKNTCLAGFAMSAIESFVKDEKQNVTGIKTRTDVMLSIKPNPLSGQVELPVLESFLLGLIKRGYKIISATWDGFQSQHSLQYFAGKIKSVEIIAIDRDKEVYYNLRRQINLGYAKFVFHPLFKTEVLGLLDKGDEHKILKTESKDLADAVSSTLFALNKHHKEWMPLLKLDDNVVRKQTEYVEYEGGEVDMGSALNTGGKRIANRKNWPGAY